MPEKGKEILPPDDLRCKRTDGRKWRCKKRVMDGLKHCEIHHLQGRHRQYKQKVPESLKIQRTYNKKRDSKINKDSLLQHYGITAQSVKLGKLIKGPPPIDESEALDKVVLKLKLKRGDKELELIRMVLKREVEKRKRKSMKKHYQSENESNSEGETTRVLPNGFMAISSASSGSGCSDSASPFVAKIGHELAAVTRRCFRSKNIEPIPICALQFEPFKRNLVKKGRKSRCHWCKKDGGLKGLIRCSSCQKEFYCRDCIRDRYLDMPQGIKMPCPVCLGTCSCRTCLASQCSDTESKGLLRENINVHQVLHFHYLICMLLPVLKTIYQDMNIELEIEAKIKGQHPSEVQIEQDELSSNKSCCTNCKSSILNLYRRCTNCSYKLCLRCSRDFRQKSLCGFGKSLSCEKSSSDHGLDCSAVLRNWNLHYINGGIPCPPSDFGGCGDSVLNLRCIFPQNWTKDLEVSAEEIVGCYELPETSDIFSKCPLCLDMDCESNEINQLQETATRDNSNDNCLYYPSVVDIQGDELEHFQKHWSKGHPVIVRNVLSDTSELSWDPIVMFCTYLENCGAKSPTNEDADCLNWFEVEIGIRQLFIGSLKGRSQSNMCREMLKLKGWLSATLFQEHFPAHYAEIFHSLPLPEYMDPDSGILNIAAKLPQETSQTKLGPCIYMSYSSGEDLALANSVTKLCYDSCDVVNILAHTTDNPISTDQLDCIRKLMEKQIARNQSESTTISPEIKIDETVSETTITSDSLEEEVKLDRRVARAPWFSTTEREKHRPSSADVNLCESCGAEWDVFRRQDIPKLLEYLRRHSNEFTNTDMVHPILDQKIFLDGSHKMRLKEEFKVEPWTFKQKVGEAVIIPSGCPYQIRNFKSCVNVVLEFISPENATECIRIIDERHHLISKHKGKADNHLEAQKMVIYGISSAIKEIREITSAGFV